MFFVSWSCHVKLLSTLCSVRLNFRLKNFRATKEKGWWGAWRRCLLATSTAAFHQQREHKTIFSPTATFFLLEYVQCPKVKPRGRSIFPQHFSARIALLCLEACVSYTKGKKAFWKWRRFLGVLDRCPFFNQVVHFPLCDPIIAHLIAL